MSEIIGKIIVLGNTETIGNNGFTKRQVVIETNEQYPQKVAIDFVKDKCTILDKYKTGQSVKVAINIRGNEYKGKYYVNLQGWKIEPFENANDVPLPSKQDDAKLVDEVEDDLPF